MEGQHANGGACYFKPKFLCKCKNCAGECPKGPSTRIATGQSLVQMVSHMALDSAYGMAMNIWIIYRLLPGPRHFEINFVQAFFKLLWPVGLQTLAKLAGYRTDKALQVCLKASDHHKAFAMFRIYFKSVAQSCCNSTWDTTITHPISCPSRGINLGWRVCAITPTIIKVWSYSATCWPY